MGNVRSTGKWVGVTLGTVSQKYRERGVSSIGKRVVVV